MIDQENERLFKQIYSNMEGIVELKTNSKRRVSGSNCEPMALTRN